ncbi:MAG: SoxR reducing system RseC family protein [Candidatus Omnitrophica bacterium]|nr:SoxR reducing system RseC family protein [Candidatus Omnitrophota bacterium]
MLKKVAVVAQAQKDKVVLSLPRDKMCGCCSNMFCGAKNENMIILKDASGLKAGDRVEVGLEGKIALFLNMLIFFIPSLVFISLVYLFRDLSIVLSFVLAVCGIILYFGLVKVSIINRFKNRLSCKIIAKLQ